MESGLAFAVGSLAQPVERGGRSFVFSSNLFECFCPRFQGPLL